jgi:hypothetical protein
MMNNDQLVHKNVGKAYRVSTPLVSITTPDAASTMEQVSEELESIKQGNGNSKAGVVLKWDAIRGLTPVETLGTQAVKNAQTVIRDISDGEPEMLVNHAEMLDRLHKIPSGSVVFILNAHLILTPDGKPDLATVQGLWNLRDSFKVNRRMVVLVSTSMTIPTELTHDVMSFEESLPTDDELKGIVTKAWDAGHGDKKKLASDVQRDAVEALSGLSAFSAEQVTFMSLRSTGLDIDNLWERKKEMIDATHGLTIWKPTTGLDDVIGYNNAKNYLRRFLEKNDINLVVWIDEMEKQLHGAEGESNGIVMDQVNVMLQEMQTQNYAGMIYLGLPGTGKSMMSQSTGKLTCQLDLGGMMHSHVGESQARIRHAMRVIKAVSRGKVLFLATCNSTAALTPALQRRFKSGKFFFDLPTTDDQAIIKQYYEKQYTGDTVNWNKATISTDGWSPANIATCSELASTMDMTIDEASSFVVPEARSSARVIDAIREQAHGVWIDASNAGPFDKDKSVFTNTPSGNRQVDVAAFDTSGATDLN